MVEKEPRCWLHKTLSFQPEGVLEISFKVYIISNRDKSSCLFILSCTGIWVFKRCLFKFSSICFVFQETWLLQRVTWNSIIKKISSHKGFKYLESLELLSLLLLIFSYIMLAIKERLGTSVFSPIMQHGDILLDLWVISWSGIRPSQPTRREVIRQIQS